MQVALKLDELTNRILGYKESPILKDDITIDLEKLGSFDLDRDQEALYYENGEIAVKLRNKKDITERIEQLQEEIAKLNTIDYGKEIMKSLTCGKSLKEAKRIYAETAEKKESLKEEVEVLQDEYQKAVVRKVKEEQVFREYKYYCSACLIIRDDNEYLQEWLGWHIGQGIDHFYIYDHGSKEPISETVKSYSEDVKNKLTIHDFSGSHEFAQHEAYNDCLKRYRNESRWIAFIDSDEMIRVKTGQTLPEFLRDYEDYAGLFMTWIMYGANGQRNKTNAYCRNRFTAVSPSKASENVGKVIVQPAYMRYMLTHNGYTKAGFSVVDEHKREVETAQPYLPDATTDLICLDHYYTKSYEEWLNKIKRGTCDPYYSRKYAEFFEYNPDMEDCRESGFPIQEYEISKI